MKKVKQKKMKDKRINAPLVSWQFYLIIFIVVLFFAIDEYFIVAYCKDYLESFVPLIIFYIFSSSVCITVVVCLIKKFIWNKPINHIAESAKKIAEGDYSARVKSMRRDGKKDEVEVLIDDFNTMAKELASTEILKSDFISNVSHEIKSPIAVIQSYVQTLKSSDLSEAERVQYLDTIMLATKKLNAMIVNILKLNKLENQSIVSNATDYQLGEQLRQCALAYMELWEKKEINFEIDVCDVTVHHDATLLELVWNNLLSNAIKFTEKGGTISLTSKEQDGFVFVTVKDSGCGMSEQTVKRIYDKFYQGDTSHSTEGNGLGMAMVKKVLELENGEITVKSEIGKGTEFVVKLPL